MLLKLFLTIALFIKCNCLLLMESENLLTKSLSTCTTSGINRHLNSTSSILVTNVPSEEENANVFFKDFFNLYTFSLIVNKNNGKQPSASFFLAKADIYFIQIRKLIEIETSLKHLAAQLSWNPSAKFVVLSIDAFVNNSETATTIVEILWRYKIVNAVVLLPNENHIGLNVYSWLPYKDGNCGEAFGTVRLIDECSFGNYSKDEEWFPNHIPNNLRGCQVKVRTIIWPPYVTDPVYKVPNTNQYILEGGVEIKMMNTIAEVANFSINYTLSDKEQDWGDLFENGTALGMMASVLNEEVDIGMCSLGSTSLRRKFFETSTIYLTEEMTFCVPHSMPKPDWQRVVSILPIEILIFCFVCIVLITLTSTKLAKFNENERLSYKNYYNTFFSTLRIITGNPLAKLPKTDKVRFLIMLWTVFSLYLNTSYTTSLVSVLTSSLNSQEVQNVEDLLKANYKIQIIRQGRRFFNDTSEITEKIQEKLIDCDDMEHCLLRVANEKDKGILAPRMYINYVKNIYVDGDGDSLIYCFRENVVSFPIEFLMRKHFILTSRINTIISRIVSAGLIPYWISGTFRQRTQSDEKYSRTFVKSTMSLKHLHFVFYMYAILIGAALFVFVGEIIKYRAFRKK